MTRCRQSSRLLSLTAVFFLLTLAADVAAFNEPAAIITSGTTTGSYYAAASAVAKIFNRKSADYGMRLSTVASPGSVANIDDVATGKAAFGIAETELIKRAVQGVRPWEGKEVTNLRGVLGLFVASVTIVAAVDTGIRTVPDLKGKRLNVGAPGSIDNTYAAAFLQMSGLNPGEVKRIEQSTALAPELLQKGEIDAYLCIVGHPNLTVLEASQGKRKVHLVPMDNALIEQLVSSNPLLTAVAVPTKYYPDLEFRGTVPSIGVRTVLFTTKDQPEEVVYRLVREVAQNGDLFRRQHPILQNFNPRDAARIPVIPLHPGAARYFREAGLMP